MRVETRREQLLGIELNRQQLRALIEEANRQDVDTGGMYDARSAMINIWCSPEDKPICWDAPLTKGAFPAERELVGDISWLWPEDGGVAAIRFNVEPIEMIQYRRQEKPLSETEWLTLKVWIMGKAIELIQTALRKII